MKRYGYAIKVGGDGEIAAALASGISAASVRKPSEAARRVAMRQHSPEEWESMIAKARLDYRRVGRRRSAAYHAVMGVIGLACLGINEAYARLSAWNRSA